MCAWTSSTPDGGRPVTFNIELYIILSMQAGDIVSLSCMYVCDRENHQLHPVLSYCVILCLCICNCVYVFTCIELSLTAN